MRSADLDLVLRVEGVAIGSRDGSWSGIDAVNNWDTHTHTSSVISTRRYTILIAVFDLDEHILGFVFYVVCVLHINDANDASSLMIFFVVF